jgi:ABC-type nitrate/sulfonate/bicarbonate transport system ATPase subunit/flavin-dependent dehydrogenase
MTSASAPAVSVRGVHVRYPGKRPGEFLDALEDVSFDVAPGEFVCIVGASGCGKSTLLNVIGGFQRPTRGEVRVQGEPVHGPDPRRIFVFQESGVFPWLTVDQNIGFGLSRQPAEERHRVVAHYVEMVGLTGFERAYPHELSGGMRQRVEIARALAASPDLLYMDEPFSALDYLTRLKMRADLVRIWQHEKKTILFVTHDIEEALQLADRVLMLTPRPGHLREVIDVPLPRPRDIDAPAYLATRHRILDILAPGTALAPASAPAAPALDADVLVVGGGPSGAILASYLARAGVRTLVLERAVHPRPHVGESLLCSTTRVFQEIGVLDAIEHGGFVRKHGALWTHHGEEKSRRLPFQPIPSLGITQDWTWHVDRGRFDRLLLEHARAEGAEVLEGVRAVDAELAAGGAAAVRVQERGCERVLRARLLVDASGRGTFLGSKLRIKRNDPALRQFAVHGWFEGVEHGPADVADWIHLHVLPGPRAWAWQIPIGPGVTSVGVVTGDAGFPKAGESVAEFFAGQVASSPALARTMAAAKPLGELVRDGNSGYAMERYAGDGWLLVGDAARFVDPIFSSGISVAAESAREAAAAIVAALAAGDTRAERFAEYAATLSRGIEAWRELVLLYYRLPRGVLALLDAPEDRAALQEVLQGTVFGAEPPALLARLRRAVAEVEANPDHPWHGEIQTSP